MAIDDNTSYELTGAQVKDLANRIKAKAADNIFVGATSAAPGSKGLVPAPQAGDDTKFLSGDGTWKTVSSGSTYTAGNGIAIDANNEISVDTTVVATQTDLSGKQDSLTAGANITISNNTISATDTTYSNFVGSTASNPGVSGLVPAPGASSKEKYLSRNGSWQYLPMAIADRFGTLNEASVVGGYYEDDNTWVITSASPIPNFVGATTQANGQNGLVPAPAIADKDKYLKGDGSWATAEAKLVEMSYGESSAWAKFIAAYNAGSIVYCRASSNADPSSGSQTRKAFMAYVNNATSPTSVEFQYVRSVSSKSDSQQSDQVFVYTLTSSNGGTWSVASRNMAPKINVSGPITKTFSSGANATITIGANAMTGATASAAGAAGVVPAPASGDNEKFLKGDGTWSEPSNVLHLYTSGITTSGFPLTTDTMLTQPITYSDIVSAFMSGKHIIIHDIGGTSPTPPATDVITTSVTSINQTDAHIFIGKFNGSGSTGTPYLSGNGTTWSVVYAR